MKALAALVAFVFVSTLTATALAFGLNGVDETVAILAFIAGGIGGILAWQGATSIPAPKLTFWDWAILGAFALAALRAFGWLVFASGDNIFVLSPNNLGDMSLHIGLIRYFAGGASFWPESLILTGVPLTYPLGADLSNALLEVCGLDTLRGLVITGLAGAALTGWALWRWGGAFGVAALIFNGGLAGFAIFSTLQFKDFQADLTWKSLFLAMLVTQRGLLCALPAGLLLLTVWRDTYFRGKKAWLPGWLQFVLYAGMPLFNFHAFLFLSVILLAIFLAQKKARFELIRLVGISFVPATVIVCLITGFFSISSGASWKPGWVADGHGWTSWIWNFGFTLPLVLVAAGLLIPSRFSKFLEAKDAPVGTLEARCFVWTSLFILVISCLFSLAPWPWDNMKLIIWAWLAIAPYLWSCVLVRLDKISRWAICFVLFFSGAVSLVGGLGPEKFSIATRSEVDAWQTASADIPRDARFAIEPTYNHPLLLLGRKVVCGYEGHLWSHGLPFEDTLSLLRRALRGETSWRDAAVPLEADWLAVRNTDTGINEAFAGNPPHGSMGLLYDLAPFKPSRGSLSVPPQRPRSVGSP